MAAVKGVQQTSWRSHTSASSTPGHSHLIELSNALKKLNYDADSFISNPDFISFLTNELSSTYVSHDSKKNEDGVVDKLKDNSFLNLRQNNQSYFDYALLQELLLSWNCYCTINIYPKLNSQEIKHNLVFDTCLGEKQIPDNVASFIKNLLDRGTDLDYIINLIMAIQSGKNINLSNIQQKQTPKKICQNYNNINQQINNRKHVTFSSKLYEESNFESEKPILPPKKSTFKNPFKPFLQIKYKPFSKSPFRPSTRAQLRPTARPPPPPAPTANTKEVQSNNISSETAPTATTKEVSSTNISSETAPITKTEGPSTNLSSVTAPIAIMEEEPSINLSSESSTLSPCPFCPPKSTKVENTFETSASDRSKENFLSSITETNESENLDEINFMDGDDLPENMSPVNSQAKHVESIQTKEAMQNNDIINNNDVDENANEKIYTVTKIQPIFIKPVAVHESLDKSECLDNNNNAKMTVEKDIAIKKGSVEIIKPTNKVTIENKISPFAKMDPIYDLDLMDNFNILQSTETDESMKKDMPPIPPPRKRRQSLLLSQLIASPEIPPKTSPIYSRPHSVNLPDKPIPPPRKHRSKHAHTLPKTKNSHQKNVLLDPLATLPKTSKPLLSHCPASDTYPLSEPVCSISTGRLSPPIPPPRRHRPTAPNNPFKPEINDSDQVSSSCKSPKKKSLKEQFIKTTEIIKQKTRSAMSQIYNTCKKIF